MKRLRTAAAIGLVLLLAGSAAAAVPAKPKSYPTGVFTVAGHVVPATAVLDARALPDMQGRPALMVTLTPAGAAALHAAADARLPCALDGKPLGDSPGGALASDHVLQISGLFSDYDAASAAARRISGRDPLPDSESDE